MQEHREQVSFISAREAFALEDLANFAIVVIDQVKKSMEREPWQVKGQQP